MARFKPLVPLEDVDTFELKRLNLNTDLLNFGKLNLGFSDIIPIISNAITIGRSSFIRVSSPSYTQLDNINGGEIGDVIVLTKHLPSNQFQVTNVGNIAVPYWLYASTRFTMAAVFDGVSWLTIGFGANQ